MAAQSASVKYFHSSMVGAPQLGNAGGTLIAVLDACLVNGFNSKVVDSIVVASNVATVTMSTGVGGFETDAVISISGATPVELNGEKRITSTGATTLTFETIGIADLTATGSMAAKLAPAGWEKSFTGTNLAAYRSLDVTGTRCFMRVDDTANVARVTGYESMTDVNTGSKEFPTATQLAGGMYWPKARSTYKGWIVIADGKTVWLHTSTANDLVNLFASGYTVGFGDFASLKSGDSYSCLLTGCHYDCSDNSYSENTDIAYSRAATNGINEGSIVVARSFTGIGGSTLGRKFSESFGNGSGDSWAGGNASGVPLYGSYPNATNNALMLSRYCVGEVVVPNIRGFMRGPRAPAQNCYNSFPTKTKVPGQEGLTNRVLVAVRGGSPTSGSPSGVSFFDITGPWE